MKPKPLWWHPAYWACVFAAMFAAVAWVYWPGYSGGFVWDDTLLVEKNMLVRSPVLAGEAFRWRLFEDRLSTYYRPVQVVSYQWDYWRAGLDCKAYRLTNMLLHTGCAAALFALLRALLRGMDLGGWARDGIAGVVALLWAVHPVHNAAVAYIAGRADPLSFMFSCLAWLVALGGLRKGRAWLGLAAVPLWALGLASKEITVVWMAWFTIWLFGFRRGPGWREKAVAAGAVLVAVALVAWLRACTQTPLAGDGGKGYDAVFQAGLALRALGDYFRLMVWPAGLMMERTVLETGERALFSAPWAGRYAWLTWAGLGAAALLVWSCWGPREGRTVRRMGFAWFLCGFLPVSNLFPLNAEVAEHWIYMPSAGLLLWGAGWVVTLPARWMVPAAAGACVAALVLGTRTRERASDWRDAETFYKATLRDAGFSPRIQLNLAGEQFERGAAGEAEATLRDLLEKKPDYANARFALGMILASAGRHEEAEKWLSVPVDRQERVQRRFTYTWRRATSLAKSKLDQRDPEGARDLLRDAAERYPDIWAVSALYADVLESLEGPEAAIREIERSLSIRWWRADARKRLAVSLRRAGRLEEAEVQWKMAARLDVWDPEPLVEMAAMRYSAGDTAGALGLARQAVRRDPKHRAALMTLGDLLLRAGDRAGALEVARKAERLLTP